MEQDHPRDSVDKGTVLGVKFNVRSAHGRIHLCVCVWKQDELPGPV